MFDVAEGARRFGHFAWIELRLFEVLGRWATSVPEPDVRMLFGAHGAHHAWHAELCTERIPELPGQPASGWIRPPNDGVVAFVGALAEPDAAELTVEKLVGVYRVLLPHVVAAYTLHLTHTNPETDPPTVRALTLILRDEHEHWHAGDLLLRSLLRTPEHVQRAIAHHGWLEQQLVTAGGIAGPGTLEPNTSTESRTEEGTQT